MPHRPHLLLLQPMLLKEKVAKERKVAQAEKVSALFGSGEWLGPTHR